MELQVRPDNTKGIVAAALFIKGAGPAEWLPGIEATGLPEQSVDVYAIPGSQAASVSGCLLVPASGAKLPEGSRHRYCQLVEGLLYLPEHAGLYPRVSAGELKKLLSGKLYFFHPDCGLCELEAPIHWETLLQATAHITKTAVRPAGSVFIPSRIRRMEVYTAPPEEKLQQMEEEIFPQPKPLESDPLTDAEKKKLNLLRRLFNPGGAAAGTPREPSLLARMLERVTRWFSKKPDNWLDRMEKDYEDLEQRNRDELQKLMDLFRNNPEEALKYAIPLDPEGTSRGNEPGVFGMQRRWDDFSLGGSQHTTGGGRALPDDVFHSLEQQYRKTATELIGRGQYEKAAFIYLKLLKNPALAADTLEEGGFYAEAAALHLKYTQNKHRAAACYIKGNMLSPALDIYIGLERYEDAGDLCLQLDRRDEAMKHYRHVAAEHISAGRYVQASLLYRKKMEDAASARELLRTGWRQNRDAYNCLNNYFACIENPESLQQEIDHIYRTETNKSNRETFLRVLKHEHERHPELQQTTRDIAYEIVAADNGHNPEMVSMLRYFNADKTLVTDIMRFKNQELHARREAARRKPGED